jgi:hypothetical protein
VPDRKKMWRRKPPIPMATARPEERVRFIACRL